MQNKTRAHRVLFDTELPFKAKVERDRKKFNRKEFRKKIQGNGYDD